MSRTFLVTIIGAAALMIACDRRVQDIRIAAQDHRFTPTQIRFHNRESVRLVIANEGRETHEFASELLADPQVRIRSEDVTPAEYSRSHSFRIVPGRSVSIILQAPRGTYLYRCKIPGHRGMTGTIIVE